ncbi:protein FAM133B-like [Palaemon carinicauda]|uniref:protein FAM133B-like n=1 Tax=Palaemon carinicauda TaxID=392227 RepID=UPI0035B5C374
MEAMKKAVRILFNGGWQWRSALEEELDLCDAARRNLQDYRTQNRMWRRLHSALGYIGLSNLVRYLCGRNGKGGETVRDEELLQNLLREIRETTQEDAEFLPAEGAFPEELEDKEVEDELEDEIDLPVEEQLNEPSLPQRGEEENVEEEKEEKEEEKNVLTLEEHRSEDDSKAERSDIKLSKKKRRRRKLSKKDTSNGEVSKEETSNGDVSKEEMNNRELSKEERNNGKLSNKKMNNKKLSKKERRKRELSKAERKNSNLSKEQSSNEEFLEEEERLDSEDIYEVHVHNYYSVLSGKEDMDRSPLEKSSHKIERKTENKRKRGRGGRHASTMRVSLCNSTERPADVKAITNTPASRHSPISSDIWAIPMATLQSLITNSNKTP